MKTYWLEERVVKIRSGFGIGVVQYRLGDAQNQARKVRNRGHKELCHARSGQALLHVGLARGTVYANRLGTPDQLGQESPIGRTVAGRSRLCR